jgi:hypothetical protein
LLCWMIIASPKDDHCRMKGGIIFSNVPAPASVASDALVAVE